MKTELIHDNYGINASGHFTVCGKDTVELTKKYGTPLYLIDECKIRRMARLYMSSAKKHFKNAKILFASKALSFKEIYRIADSEGLCADTVSAGEIYTAVSAGFPPEKIYFHGNNKTYGDIKYALETGIGYFVADNAAEIDMIEKVCEEQSANARVIVRVTPGIDPHTHEKISTGKVDSKFGVAIETGQAYELVGYALEKAHIKLCGIHCHVGSQSFDPGPFLNAADIMMKFIAEIRDKYGFEMQILNLGGGFGVRYVPEQKNLDIEYMLSSISEKINENCKKYKLKEPEVNFEPGRSIVAAAGVTLYTVGNVKTITGYKSYISVDGGMADNPRYTLYKAPYYCLIADKADKETDFTADIAGRCCESGDVIQESVDIKKPDIGDILAVCVTGAYNYSMSSNYNRLPKPPVVILNESGSRIGVKRESFEDLVKNDI